MKYLLSLLTILSAIAVTAQPVIVSSSSPQAGDMWTELNTEDVGGITLGSGGANQMWTYTSFTEEFSADVLHFQDPADLPSEFDGLFPDANLCFYTEEDSSAQFFKILTDGFYIDGFQTFAAGAEPPFNMQDFEPDNLLFPFDITYTDIRNQESLNVVTIDGDTRIQVRSRIFTEIEADGYGTAVTPAGKFTNVLRLKSSSYSIDSVFADLNGGDDFMFVSTEGPTDEEISYAYLQNADPLVVAIIDMNDEDPMVIDRFSYFQVGVLSTQENEAEIGIQLYPNPSQGEVALRTEGTGRTQVMISDVSGKQVHTETYIATSDVHQMDLGRLTSGMYSVQVTNDLGSTVSRLCIE